MNFKEKVVGTTFQNHTAQDFHVIVKGKEIETHSFAGQITPEPTNPHDPFAKLVEAFIEQPDGSKQVVTVGYVAKDSDVYRRTKVNKKKPIPCTVVLKTYEAIGLNNSFSFVV